MALDGSGHLSVVWPCDCNAQRSIVKTLITDIEAQDTLIRTYAKKQMQIFSSTPPSVAQWQTQWLLKGNTLPLPDGIECLWFDTSGNTYGNQYFTVNGYVYPTEMLRYRGLIYQLKAPRQQPQNIGTTIGGTASGLNHWLTTDNGSGFPGAVDFVFDIPAQLIGKNYFVKFNIPYWANFTTNWTVWYEGTNLYNTLFGGTGQTGFGTTATSSNQGIVELVVEIPAGGVVTTIEVRIAALSTGGVVSLLPQIAGSSANTTGRTTAEFILKVE